MLPPMDSSTVPRDRIAKLLDIKYEALYIEQRLLEGGDVDKGAVDEAIAGLVERFYRENGDFVSRRQYETARGSFEYFVVLLEMVLARYREGE